MDKATKVGFQRYQNYQDSGVEWLGEIPEGWNVKRLASFGHFSKGGGFSKNDLKSKGTRAVLYGDIYTKYDFTINDAVRFVSQELADKSVKINRGDLLFTGSGETKEDIGKCVLFDGTDFTVAGGDVIIFKHKNNNSHFLKYILNSSGVKSEKCKTAKGEIIVHTYGSKLRDIYISIPPLPEQTAIARFLDEKTAKIDAAIAKKERLIQLLKERKQIMIQQAVTKGLDPNVKMKDSQVEWIGEIPEGWELEPIKYSLKGMIDCEHKTAPFVDEKDYLVVRTTNVKNGKLILEGAKYTHEKGFINWTKRGVPEPGDILLTREAPAGEACLVPDNLNLCLGQRMVWLKVNKEKLIPALAIHFIYSNLGRTYIDFLSSGSTVLHFNMSDIGNIPIINMTLKEQKKVVCFIEENAVKIDISISLQQTQIDKLKEYKATLIDSAVTGKIKVSGVNSEL